MIRPSGALVSWLALTAVSAVLLLVVPDDLLGDERLFSLSSEHGPTIANALAILPAIVGTVIYLVWIIGQRCRIGRSRPLTTLAVIALAAVGMCIVAARNNWNGVLIAAASTAFLSQLLLGLFLSGERLQPDHSLSGSSPTR